MLTSLHIQATDVGKKFYGRWLFRNISHDSAEAHRLALIGKNGSGKSTLMRILAGQMSPSEGKLAYLLNGTSLPANQWYQLISWSGPQIDLYPDLTLSEHIRLHFRFRDCLLPASQELIELLRLRPHANKSLRYYSSGMLQRVQVGLALFTQSHVLMLDEPTSHMDEENARLMLELVETYLGDRLFILASNLEREYQSIPSRIHLR
ncbi:MAG: ATP-binding cassette domain-containing protein [Bacteroidota bacterium]